MVAKVQPQESEISANIISIVNYWIRCFGTAFDLTYLPSKQFKQVQIRHDGKDDDKNNQKC